MYDNDLIRAILGQIYEAAGRIKRRFSTVQRPDDFLADNDGLDRLDAICMMLIAIGESLKHLDKITDGKLLSMYPEVDWKGAKGARDIISHHYFDLNAEAVFGICQDDIPGLIATVERMIKEMDQGS